MDAWEEPERVQLIRAWTWGPRGQQAAWECQLQAANINFLYIGRAVPVAGGTRLCPSRALCQAEPIPGSQQKWA